MYRDILFVDDERLLLSSLERSLSRSFNVFTAISGREGLELIGDRSQPFPAVVVDLRMPEMGGLEFIEAAREKSPKTEFLVLTGWDQQFSSLDEAVNLGRLSAFLRKPCTSRQLKLALEQAIQRYDLGDSRGSRQQQRRPGAGGAACRSDVDGSPGPSVPACHSRIGGETQRFASPKATEELKAATIQEADVFHSSKHPGVWFVRDRSGTLWRTPATVHGWAQRSQCQDVRREQLVPVNRSTSDVILDAIGCDGAAEPWPMEPARRSLWSGLDSERLRSREHEPRSLDVCAGAVLTVHRIVTETLRRG